MPRIALVIVPVAVLLHYALRHASREEYPVHEKGGILVTGASSGIGKDAAIELSRKGYMVFAGVRSQKDADALVKEAMATLKPGVPGSDKAGMATLKPVIVDVTKQETVDSCYETVVKELGNLPFVALVNNAGIAKTYPVELMNLEDAKWNYEVNYFGMIRVTQKFLPLLRKTGKGARIVQISSIAGLLATAGTNPYSSTKFAMESISESLRRELHPFGISVSCVNPGFIKTNILEAYSELKAEAPPEHVKLYPHVLSKTVMQKEKEFQNEAPTTEVTTAVIVHAVSDPYPQLQYVVGVAAGLPMSVTAFLSWLLPGRLFDALLRIG